MKTSPMLILGLGVLLAGSLLAQNTIAGSEWQSLKILQTVDPIFPHRIIDLAVTSGEARVAINVDATGKLAEYLVIGYTQREFADAAVAALKQWAFEPARLRGEPVGTINELLFRFEARGVVVTSLTISNYLEGELMRIREGSYEYRPYSPQELDRIPLPVVSVTPQYPQALAAQGVKGRVAVEFYIDETGAVRMPAVSAKDDAVLTALAVDALSHWKFTPPTSKGRGVLVKAVQEFDFKNGG